MDPLNESGILPQDLPFAMHLIKALAGDEELTLADWKWLQLCKSNPEYTVYQYIIGHLTGSPHSKAQARHIWRNIVRHKGFMERKLGRNPGIFIAALDYLNTQPDRVERYTIMPESSLIRCLEMSLTDSLTGVYNRSAFNVMMEKSIEKIKRSGGQVSLLMIDIDNFSDINNSFGHLAGDKVLVKVAGIISENVRSMDIVGRYGGDEFMALLPSAGAVEARDIAERIRLQVAEWFEQEKQITLSIGIAVYPENCSDLVEFIQAADDALYRIKKACKNGVLVAGQASYGGGTGIHARSGH